MKRIDFLDAIAKLGFTEPNWIVELGPPKVPNALQKHRLSIRYAGEDSSFAGTSIIILGATPQDFFNALSDRLWRGADVMTITAARWRQLAERANKLTRHKRREAI